MHSLTDKEFGTMSEICSMVVPNEPSSLSLKSIRTKGTIPSPRSNFSICKFSPHQVFLYGGSNEEDDLSDAYILDLISMSWAKVDIAINFPLVGHQSVTLHRSLNQTRPSIYIFGGWNGSNYFNKSLLIDPEDFKVMITTCDESFMDSPPEPTNKHLSSSNPNPKTLMKSVSLFVTPPKAPKTSQFCPMTPNGGEKSFIFKEALTNSDHFRNAKRITWMGTTNSDKTQSGNTLKIGFDGKIPSSRKDHTLTVDSKGKRLFLFGGWNSSATDESDLLCMWVLGSNWQWTKLLPEGDIPSIRRGHTSVCIENDDALIIYGGCSGYNGILDDCYHYHIQTNRFKKIKPIEAKFYPEGRAWHSAFLIDQWIYYYGGLKLGLNPTKEVVAFDFNNHMWFNLNYTTDNSIRDLERFGHGAISINTSILVFGGTAFQLADKHTLGLRPKEKKISLEEVLVFETYNGTPLDLGGLKMIIPEKKPKEGVYALDQSGVGKIKPPPIPQEFQNPKNLLEEQTNFWHWNPHIFPEDANRRKIHYFKHKAEEEAIKSKTSNIYVDFEGLDDDESTSPTFSKSSQQFEVI